MTITGSGSLTSTTYLSSAAVINKTTNGDMTIKGTTLNITNTHTENAACSIVNNGSVIIDAADVTINTARCYGIVKSSKYNTVPTDPTKGITVKNGSNLVIDGIADAEGNMSYAATYLIKTKGPIVFDNSNVRLIKGTTNNTPVFSYAPEIIGSYSSKIAGQASLNSSYPSFFGLMPGDKVTTSYRINKFEIVHKHVPSDCTKTSLCPCGREVVDATATEHELVQAEAKEPTCMEEGWEAYEYCANCAYSTKVPIPATGIHSIIQVAEKAPTCGEIGWEAYEYCELCSLNTMVELPATGEHTYAYADGKKVTCEESGWEPYKYCVNCDYSEKKVILASGILSQMPFYIFNGDVPSR